MYITSDPRYAPGGEYFDNDVADPTYSGDGRYGTGLEYLSSSNPMYDAYYKANPWVGQTYHKTLIDKLFGGIFRTGYDKWRDEMSANAAQYNAGVVDMQQQNQYNSEEAKAMRMRAAGENPDLLGTSDVSEAAQTNPDAQDPQIPETDDVAGAFGAVMNFIGGFRELFSGAFAMMKTFQDINLNRIKADVDVASLASEDLFREIPAAGFKSEDDFYSWFDHAGQYFDDENFAEFYRKQHNIPLSLFPRYKRAFIQARNNLPTELKYYQDATARAELKQKLRMLQGSDYYSEDLDTLDAVVAPLVKLQDENKKLQAEIAVLKSKNEQRTEGDIIPEQLDVMDSALDVQAKQVVNASIQADITGDYLEGLQSEGYGNELSAAAIAQIKIGKLIAQAQSEIIANLKNLSDDGNRFAKCLEYQMVLSQFYNFNPAQALTGIVNGATGSIKDTKQTAAMLARAFF